mmetsp:Transcript_8141/g.21094  ORF Transcript_8141/g.21094 Transcript_8141/m.21094 type:complete len:249 (+) Transcript_8141:342-1088(+)
MLLRESITKRSRMPAAIAACTTASAPASSRSWNGMHTAVTPLGRRGMSAATTSAPGMPPPCPCRCNSSAGGITGRRMRSRSVSGGTDGSFPARMTSMGSPQKRSSFGESRTASASSLAATCRSRTWRGPAAAGRMRRARPRRWAAFCEWRWEGHHPADAIPAEPELLESWHLMQRCGEGAAPLALDEAPRHPHVTKAATPYNGGGHSDSAAVARPGSRQIQRLQPRQRPQLGGDGADTISAQSIVASP